MRRDPEYPVRLGKDTFELENQKVEEAAKVYLMLNKPRGLVTTTQDEKGRDTVYDCFKEASLPHLSAVGRLDKASEGLLLFTNDTAWAAQLMDPASHVDKTYHVQIAALADEAMLERLRHGVEDQGERLQLKAVSLVRTGQKNSWLEITLDEGRNRHIRRVLNAYGIEVLRLIRVAIGGLPLGDLAKGGWRVLTKEEHALFGRRLQ